MSRQHFRIFMASPGDVNRERELALEVLEQLPYDPSLRQRVTVEAVAWDKKGAGAPLLANFSPQESISQGLPPPSECDIVVVIVWSRIGTPLSSEYKKANGELYLSGTEWEYEDAMEASKKDGKPKVLVYRRTELPAVNLGDPTFQEKYEQYLLVKRFFSSFNNPDGSIGKGYNRVFESS